MESEKNELIECACGCGEFIAKNWEEICLNKIRRYLKNDY